MANQKNSSKSKPLATNSQKLVMPPSETNLAVNFIGLGFSIFSLLLMRAIWPTVDIQTASLIAMACAALPIVLIEMRKFRVYEKASTGLGAKRESDPERVAVKLIGLIGTFGYLALLYWALPEYGKPFFDRYWQLLSTSLPLLLIGAIPYFWWLDGKMREPEDGYWHFGLFVLLQWGEVDWKRIGPHARDWLVKGFFFPLMFLYTGGNALMIINYDFNNMNSFQAFFEYANNLLFYADLIFAAVGYVLTFRIFDTHIRSSEPTFRGWVVAVVCYAPFWQGLFYASYFSYDDGLFWTNWLADYEGVKILWGCAILVLVTIYSSATVCLGVRFSNLTYRGLVTNGAYRFTKHPAYVSKNLSWWLISIPFISMEGPADAFKHCLLLAGVNLIYYLRARTEEAHLSNYPEYVQYGMYMNEHSIFAPLAKVMPFLKYKGYASPMTVKA